MPKGVAVNIIKSSGEKSRFSPDKLRHSLSRSGADRDLVEQIMDKVEDELYEGITTNEIYNRAFALLKGTESVFASRYKLKKSIYELGPTGFPFELFVGALLRYSGYITKVNVIVNGICVSHEIDVVAEKNGYIFIIECKFHGEEGRKCDVKIPLYIHARYNDVKAHWISKKNESKILERAWVVTNTRFTSDAVHYGKCVGMYLLSWDYPAGDSLKDRIDRLGLYPITVSTLLSNREKKYLLSREVVLCRQLLEGNYLDQLGISQVRKEKIMNEISQLCYRSK